MAGSEIRTRKPESYESDTLTTRNTRHTTHVLTARFFFVIFSIGRVQQTERYIMTAFTTKSQCQACEKLLNRVLDKSVTRLIKCKHTHTYTHTRQVLLQTYQD